MSSVQYDVAIAGGGPAGALCAIRLVRLGWRVLLADDGRAPAGAGFPEMLAPDACWLLVQLGLEDALLDGASAPCRGILSFWKPEEPQLLNFALTRLRDGQVVDRQRFDANLRRLAASAGVDVRFFTRFRFSGSRGSDPITFHLESRSGDEMGCTATFVVEAAGRNAISGAVQDNCAARIYFDRLIAIALDSDAPCGTDEWFRIAPSRNGWWYSFRRGSSTTSVFLTDADLLPKDPVSRTNLLSREWRGVSSFLGAPCESGNSTRLPRDARTSCRRVLWRNRCLPLGDAAFTVDPISGSGLSRALGTANSAASAVHPYLTTGTATALSEHAVSLSREFAASLATSRKYYREAAGYFPRSSFWLRRSDFVLSRSTGLNQRTYQRYLGL